MTTTDPEVLSAENYATLDAALSDILGRANAALSTMHNALLAIRDLNPEELAAGLAKGLAEAALTTMAARAEGRTPAASTAPVEGALRALLFLAMEELLHVVEATDFQHENRKPPLKYTTPWEAITGARNTYNMLKAQLPALSSDVPQTGWRTIDSAPTDEAQFLAATTDGRVMIWSGNILKYAMDHMAPDHLRFPATHWRPLPTPPSPEGK